MIVFRRKDGAGLVSGELVESPTVQMAQVLQSDQEKCGLRKVHEICHQEATDGLKEHRLG